MYNDAQRWIQFTAGAPSSGQTVKVFGSAKVPIVAHASDAASIATYGEYQGVITDSKITSVPEAQAARAGADPPVRPSGLRREIQHARSRMRHRPGDHGQSSRLRASTNTLIIKRIEAVGYAPGANGMLEYQIECIGSDVVTFTDLMQSILQQEATQTTVDDSTVNENLVPTAETVGIIESVTVSGASGPYEWGPNATTPMRWGFFTWS